MNHIDTSDYYGPHVTNQLIREALHPYPDDLVIVTKIGARRGTDGSVLAASSPDELIRAVHDNLRNLDVDALEVVNLRNVFDDDDRGRRRPPGRTAWRARHAVLLRANSSVASDYDVLK